MNIYLYNKLYLATIETVYLTFIAILGVGILGTILGVLLFVTGSKQFYYNKVIYSGLSSIVNIIRSIPFIILIIILLPVTKFLMGTILGPNAGIPALILGVAPFYGKMVESSLKEVNLGLIEAAKSLGAYKMQIIFKVLIPEIIPLLVANLTSVSVAIVSYTAMVGVIGAGGLGNFAFIEGFQRNNQVATFIATIIILLLVFVIQLAGDKIVKVLDKR